jgi:hypothetical protein
MHPLPAICSTCGLIFPVPPFFPRNSTVVIDNVKAGPCPRCGAWGQIPDGTYETVRGTLRMLLKDPASVQALQSLARILQAAWDTRADPETVADRVEAEAPELSGFAQALRALDLKNWQWWLIFLLTVIQTLVALGVVGPERQAISDHQIERTMRHVLDEATVTTRTSPTPSTGRPGRNDPCPCGSGKKYKRCHLRSAP